MSTIHEPSAVAPARKQEQSPRHEWREYVAREVKKLPAPVRGLLFQLYDRMDFRGECWASNENLADELDVKPRSVRNYIAAARERGLLDVVMTDRGRVFRATIPSSNVVPIRRGDRNLDAGGWQPVATKAGKPVEPKGETGSLQSPVSTDKPNTSGLETPEASRPPEESSPRNVTQDLSDELGGSTRLVTKTSDPETWQRLNAEAEAEALRKIAEHRRRFGADS
jgi:Helix-turn-helix domain